MGVGPAQRPSARANTKLCRTRPMELVSPPLLVLGRALATPNFGGQRPTRRRETRPDVGWGLGWPNAQSSAIPCRVARPHGTPPILRGAACLASGVAAGIAKRRSPSTHFSRPATGATLCRPPNAHRAQRPKASACQTMSSAGGGPAAGSAQPASPQLTGSLPQRPSAQRPSAASRRGACPHHGGDPAVRRAWPPGARIEGRPPSIANRPPSSTPLDPGGGPGG